MRSKTMEQTTKDNFIKYNKQFFNGSLDKIQLQWSDRMKLSAAIFYPNKHKLKEQGKICFNRKLLQTRSDTEVLETLLHEMTHAYLEQQYGTSIKPHGKEFKAKILEINIALDLNITTHHSFLLWWRCDGVCNREELYYYGYLSGVNENHTFTSNPRAVACHKQLCGGTFQKIPEPNSEILADLRRIKRSRKALIEKEILKRKCCDKTQANSTSRHAPKRSKMTHYSTDDE